MSGWVTGWVLKHAKEIPPARKLVLIALADEANDEGVSCYPSIRSIAEHANVGVGTARNHIRELELSDLIVVDRPAKQGRGHFNRYGILMDREAEEVRLMLDEERGRKSTPLSRERVQERAERVQERAAHGPRKPKTQDPRPKTEVVEVFEESNQLESDVAIDGAFEDLPTVEAEELATTEDFQIEQIIDVLADRSAIYLERPKKKPSRKDRKAIELLVQRGSPGLEHPDPQSPDKVIRLINAVFDWPEFEFWRDKLQSGHKLRKHWDALIPEARKIQAKRAQPTEIVNVDYADTWAEAGE